MTSPLQVIQQHYAASSRADLDGMVAPFAPYIQWTEMAGFPYAGTYVGPAAVKENVFLRLASEWENYQAVPEHFVCQGEEVVAFGLYTGACRATGKRVAARFVHHWTTGEGKVTAFQQYTDTRLFAEAMS